MLTLSAMRQFAVSRSLFLEPTLIGAVQRLGYVQTDPMQAPARAQDLILRQRMAHYRVGDLERCYPTLPLEEDFFINYGYLPKAVATMLHPRHADTPWPSASAQLANQLLEHVRAHGPCHPSEVSEHFGRATTTNNWGGQSAATTRLLDALRHRNHLRVAKREAGIRVYAVATNGSIDPTRMIQPTHSTSDRAGRLLQVLLQQYAPLPKASLRSLSRMLARSVPDLDAAIRAELDRMCVELPQANMGGVTWVWPEGEQPAHARWSDAGVRLLAPFDPLVWDRARFELLWGWAYRFEAYTPASKRQRGHYALPVLVGSDLCGWANVQVQSGRLHVQMGFVKSMHHAPWLRNAVFEELAAMGRFLGLSAGDAVITRHPNSVF